MSSETDPLVVDDPHQFSRDDIKGDNNVAAWMKIESDVPPSETYAEPVILFSGMSSTLQTQAPANDASEDNSNSNEWTHKIQRKRGKKWSRKSVDEENETDSDEENMAPAKTDDDYGNSSCKVCHKIFGSVSLLNEHFSNSCCGCSNSFEDAKNLTERLRSCRNGEIKKETKSPDREKNGRCKKYYEQLKIERKYQCEVCHKDFITSGHLNTHMYRHSGKKWTCNGCGKNFSCERSLMRHKDTFPGEHSFSCKHCEATFFRAVNLAKHMEIKHPEAFAADGRNQKLEEFLCKLCLKSFLTSEMLTVHKEAMHSSEDDAPEKVDQESCDVENMMRFRCEVCGKEFLSLEGFEYHTANQHVHKEVKKKKKQQQPHTRALDPDDNSDNDEATTLSFSCKVCTVTFPTKLTLQTHLKSHNVTKNVDVKVGSHQCCICPRSFSSSDGLKYHLATHTGERRYSCGQCGKRFIKKTHLSEHIATHSEVKYFKCPKCPRTFSTHSAYRKHLKHFPGPHSFPCRKCGKLFTKESMIEKHMCVDLVKITMAPEVKALLSEDMIEEYLCLAEEQMAEEMSISTENAPHSCYKCFKVFPSLSALQSHQNDHIGKQSYQCRFCPDTFKRADAFGAHIRNHLGSTPYMCLKCNRKFISPFTLSMHAKNYPGEHSFTCKKCQRWFPSEKRLERHECILENSETFKCACGLSFTSWKELLSHAGAKPYKCCSCEFTYPTLTALARHIKKHTGVKPFTCEACGKSFRARNNYLNHKNVHRDVAEIQCEHCEYKSKSRKRMDFHLFRKHDIGSNTAKSTLCPMCGITFPYMSQMKKHMDLDHGSDVTLNDAPSEKKSLPPELCTLCGKMLNNKYTLANHMKKVHDPNTGKRDRKIKCEFCDERFHTMRKLQRHTEIHEPPGIHTCNVCHKEFYFAKELRKHMRRHDTNKPFSCPQCGKHFKVSVSLKYHSTICGQRSGTGRRRKERNEMHHQQHQQLSSSNRQELEHNHPQHPLQTPVTKNTTSIIYTHTNATTIDLNNQPYIVQVYGM